MYLMSRNFLKNMFGSKFSKNESSLAKRNDSKFLKDKADMALQPNKSLKRNASNKTSNYEDHQKKIDNLDTIVLPSKQFYKKLNDKSSRKEALNSLSKITQNQGKL